MRRRSDRGVFEALVLGLTVGGAVALGGCRSTVLNPNHCTNNDGDAFCREFYDDRRPYCIFDDEFCPGGPQAERGCVASRPASDCWSPCGNGERLDDDAACTVTAASSTGETPTASSTGETTGTGSSGSSSGSASSTGPTPCVSNDDCVDIDAPYCSNDGECRPCGEASSAMVGGAACAALDDQRPQCAGDSCVACVVGATELCDQSGLACVMNECVPCREHAQCTSGACELDRSRCFPLDAVTVTVDGDGGADAETIAEALAEISAGGYGIVRVHALDGGIPYLEQLLVDQGKTVALLAADAEEPVVQGTGVVDPGLRVEGLGTKVYIDGLSLADADIQGLVVDGAFAWVDRGRIVQNSGGGVLANNAAELTLRNCFVGGDISDVAAVALEGATATILYTTLGAGFGDASALRCAGAPNAVSVRNSLLVARTDADELQCADATVESSVAEQALGGSNAPLGAALDLAWFMGYAAGDFHLTGAEPMSIATTARWRDGDPATDIDDDARPINDDSVDYAGGDRP